jgi:hypothetical protein
MVSLLGFGAAQSTMSRNGRQNNSVGLRPCENNSVGLRLSTGNH